VALRYPLFARLWAGSMVSSIGTQMSNTAKLWVLYALTRSAVTLGIDGLCFSVPIVVLPIMAGPICDRVDRRTVIKASMAVESVEAAALAAAAAAGLLRPWIIYLAAATEAARLAFDIPARTALTTALVPGNALHSAQSLSAVVWNSAALIGPALGGLLLASTGATAVFAVNSISTLIVGVSFLPVGRAPLPVAGDGRRTRASDGLRYAFAHRELLVLQAILLATSTAALGTETLLPVLDRVVWHGGATAYGMLRAAPGIAAVLTGVRAAATRPARQPARTLAFGLMGAGAALIAFSLAPLLAVGVVLLALAFVAISVCQILVATRVQQVTPERLRGAVSGFNAITQSGLAGVAAAGMAFTAASLGARVVIMAVAAVTAVTGAIAPLRRGGLSAPPRSEGRGGRLPAAIARPGRRTTPGRRSGCTRRWGRNRTRACRPRGPV
jgi:MFS family permease